MLEMSSSSMQVCLLDGGTGQVGFSLLIRCMQPLTFTFRIKELVLRAKAKGFPIHPLWSAKVLIDHPSLVRDLHKEFIKAGARVITVNSYSLTRYRLEKWGLGHRFSELQESAVRLALEARSEACKDSELGDDVVRIAGCLPPMSSYRPDAATDDEVELESIYSEIAKLQTSGVDLFLCETMSSYHEASCAVRAAKSFGKPVWCALSVSDDNSRRLRSGELLAEVLPRLEKLEPDVILLNCSVPEAIEASIDVLFSCSVPVGAYMNAFKSVQGLATACPGKGTVETLEAREDIDVSRFVKLSMDWVRKGLHVIGGCCEITPTMIGALKKNLVADGYTIK